VSAAVAPDHPRAAGTAVPPAPDEDAVPPIETAAALGPRERARISALLDDRFSGGPGRVAVSVQDLRTGAAFGYAADAEFRVASVVKLDMVVHMLLDAQREDRFLTDREQALAERMLCHSDNDAADTAFRRNGFTSGFADATARLGLADTSPHENGAWGMSSTTAADRLRLLRAVFTDASPLDERSRAYLRSLMGAVAPEQAWGISAAAGPGTAELKNGWAPAPGGGPWNVHSTGSVERDGRRYLAAVLTDGAPDYGTGVATVEDAAGLVIEELGTALDRHP
ncbi:serine hydrolase, partial [Streptomonospora salina]|uniref:serine hydrolase n=1 Tax=Streptomonospora salina TaxID=104205 RepID=UPI0035EC7A32